MVRGTVKSEKSGVSSEEKGVLLFPYVWRFTLRAICWLDITLQMPYILPIWE
jgi:hypothetical protein